MGISVAWGITQDPWVRILVDVLFTSYCRLVKFAIEQAMIHGKTAAAHAIKNCSARGDRRGKVDSSGSLVIFVRAICAIFV